MNDSPQQKQSIPLLVLSCDRYSDIWEPFFAVFRKMWPDCPFPVFLGTELKEFSGDKIKTIRSGEKTSWAHNLLLILDQIESDYVLLFLEDFFLLDRVDTARIEKLARLAVNEQMGCLRLFSILPPPQKLEGTVELGYFLPGDDYRVTLQVAIWRVETLKKLLVPGFNPWEFEILGSKISAELDEKFYGVINPAFNYEQVVEKGKWKPAGIRIAREAGVEPDLTARGVFSDQELSKHLDSASRESAAGKLYDIKRSMLEAFKVGKRLEGLRQAARYLKKKPFSGQIILGASMGLLGPGWLSRLVRFHLNCRLTYIRCRFRLSRFI